MVPGVDSEFRERLTTLEAQNKSQSATLTEIKDTLRELVRHSIQNEDNRKRIEVHEEEISCLRRDVDALRTEIKSKWWVLATIASVLTIIINILWRLI